MKMILICPFIIFKPMAEARFGKNCFKKLRYLTTNNLYDKIGLLVVCFLFKEVHIIYIEMM
ncbi:MAG: hypothetical protein PWP27_1302 [Clostridiales bacterium]|nr:hypothetical protein [Clostridiales bacterium]MDK2933492.1 hypothetical protein [Clostridiales bacterium]